VNTARAARIKSAGSGGAARYAAKIKNASIGDASKNENARIRSTSTRDAKMITAKIAAHGYVHRVVLLGPVIKSHVILEVAGCDLS
jgi:hypothetical protein